MQLGVGRTTHNGCLAPFILSLVMSAMSIVSVSAQELTDTSNYRITLENPLGVFPLELEEAVSQLANPEFVVVEAGTTLLDTRKKSCPGASQNYFDGLEQNLNDLNNRFLGDKFDIHTPVSQSTFAVVPACVGSQFYFLKVERGLLIESFFTKSQSGSIPLTNLSLTEFLSAVESVNNLNGFTNIPAGSFLAIPPSAVTFQTTGPNAILLQDALENFYDRNDIVVDVISDQSTQDGRSDSIDGDCTPNDMASVFESTLDSFGSIYESILINSLLIKEQNRMQVNIAVFDAGVRRIHHPLITEFARPAIIRNRGGSTLGSYQGPFDTPICLSFNDPAHSEAVAGVALGGYFSVLQNNFSNIIKVHSHNIYIDRPTTVVNAFATETVVNAFDSGNRICLSRAPSVPLLQRALFDMAPRTDIDVVNLSQSWPLNGSSGNDINSIESIVNLFSGNSAPFLLVVSAGNNAQSLEVDKSARLPASRGGDDHTAMIVVAATQGNGSLHPASSFSNESVDIGALGCNVPTVLFDPFGETDNDGFIQGRIRPSFESGTSFAAPQVTYTAAMILYLAGENRPSPIEVKRRILISADINGLLEEEIIHGRMLNVPYALNIYTDLIKLNDENRTILLRGIAHLGDPTSIRAHVCPGLILEDPKKLLRIAKISGGDEDGRYRIYFLGGSGLKTKICDGLSQDISYRRLEANGEFSDEIEILSRDKIIDIVFSMYH